MNQWRIQYDLLAQICQKVFTSYGFSGEQAKTITDVLLQADLYGIESHGVQRLVRYHDEIRRGMVVVAAEPEIVHETAVSAVVDARQAMGQLVGVQAMQVAIEKAEQSGIGLVAVRNSNHYGIAGFYTKMACDRDLIGISMTNTEAIMVPAFGRQAMLGTDPIAVAMPADPIPFLFDASTTVVTRGKIEVHRKKGAPLPAGWALDAQGDVTPDATLVLDNIINRRGGGILPLGGAGEQLGGHKGYGLALICELFTGIMAGGPTANHLSSVAPTADISHCFWAIDYDLFGNKQEIREHFSTYLKELRASARAVGQERIYTHGEKELERCELIKHQGIPINGKTFLELEQITRDCGLDPAMINLLTSSIADKG
jgi:LDH2 family malate/lactate/ureidoglycolate dehydrogenase